METMCAIILLKHDNRRKDREKHRFFDDGNEIDIFSLLLELMSLMQYNEREKTIR